VGVKPPARQAPSQWEAVHGGKGVWVLLFLQVPDDRQIGLLHIDLVEVNWKLREARKAHLELTARVGDAAAAAFGPSKNTGASCGRALPLLCLRHMR